MPLKVTISAASILTGGLLWAGRLLFGTSPWSTPASSLTAIGLVAVTAVTVVAMVLSPGRWVRNSVGAVGGAWASIAAAVPVDPVWIIAFAVGGAGIALAWLRPLDEWFHQINPHRVPPKAAVLALGLIWMPLLVGGLGVPDVTPGGWAAAAFGITGGWAYARALPGALWTVRLAFPILGAASVIGLRFPAAAGLLAVTAFLTHLAWTEEARLAVQPPAPRRVKPVSILPEVTPPGLLESAGYDRRGRPLEEAD